MKTNTLIGLGILGVAGYVLWKMRKPAEFQDKELQKLVDDLKTMPELPPVFVPTGVTVSNPDPWVDRRPTYENAVFEDVESYLATNPNAHLIRRGWNREFYALDKDVKQLTKEEFEKAGVILVDGKVMIKDYYIDYILKPDPKVIGEAMQAKIDAYNLNAQLNIPIVPKVPVPIQSPNDPLKAVASPETISMWDPDRVTERTRLGEEVGYTGVRQPRVIISSIGTAYSDTTKIDGVPYGVPIEGAKITQTVSGQDGTLLYKNEYVMQNGNLVAVISNF
jgi:hypothetical protein